jgi:UDP-N-acetylglucosamine:LPS N-acetylglucosamine transferase
VRQSRRVVIVSASIGAGHDGAAWELARRLGEAGFTVDCLDFVDLVPLRIGRLLRTGYRRQLDLAPGSWQWLQATLGHEGWTAQAAIGIAATAARRLRTAIGGDCLAVVSTYPMASQVLGRMRRSGQLSVPVVTYLTDMSVHPLWVAAGVDVHLAIHRLPAAEAAALGAAGVEVIAPAVAPAFGPIDVVPAGRDQVRRRFGLPNTGRLVLVATGSWGVGEAEQSARDIAATGLAVPVVACGHNDRLRERLVATRTGVALGWVDDMPALIGACDVVVQNAGGLSSLEALTAGTAVVSYRCVPGHGRANAYALDQAGLAAWIRDREQLGPMLAEVLNGPRGPEQRAAGFAMTHGPDPARAIAAVAAPGDPRHTAPMTEPAPLLGAVR